MSENVSKIDLDNLERCATEAERPCPSPWVAANRIIVDRDGDEIGDAGDKSSLHIAASDPATVLALVRVVRAALAYDADDAVSNKDAAEFFAALEPFRKDAKP